MAAGNTYTPLATYTAPSTQASYTFSSISGSYTDLVLEMNIQGVTSSGSGANTVYLEFNGDTGTNYSRTILLGDSGGASSGRNTSQAKMSLGNAYETTPLGSIYGTLIVNVQNYSNATTYKTVVNRYSSNGDRVGANVGLWRSTAAITSIKVTVDSANGIAQNSTLSLYGILAA